MLLYHRVYVSGIFKWMSFCNIVSNLHSRLEELSTKCFSSRFDKRPSTSEEPFHYTSQSMTSLHAHTLKHWHTTAALLQIVIFICRATCIATKSLSHCNRYGIFRSLK